MDPTANESFPAVTSAAIKIPSVRQKKSSRPSRRQRGVVAPAEDTCHFPLAWGRESRKPRAGRTRWKHTPATVRLAKVVHQSSRRTRSGTKKACHPPSGEVRRPPDCFAGTEGGC